MEQQITINSLSQPDKLLFWVNFIQDNGVSLSDKDTALYKALECLRAGVDEYRQDGAAACVLQLHFVAGLHNVTVSDDNKTLYKLFKRYSFEPSTILNFFYFLVNYEDDDDDVVEDEPDDAMVEEAENRFSGFSYSLFGGSGVDTRKRVQLPSAESTSSVSLHTVRRAIARYIAKRCSDHVISAYIPLEKRSRQVDVSVFTRSCLLPDDLLRELQENYFS